MIVKSLIFVLFFRRLRGQVQLEAIQCLCDSLKDSFSSLLAHKNPVLKIDKVMSMCEAEPSELWIKPEPLDSVDTSRDSIRSSSRNLCRLTFLELINVALWNEPLLLFPFAR